MGVLGAWGCDSGKDPLSGREGEDAGAVPADAGFGSDSGLQPSDDSGTLPASDSGVLIGVDGGDLACPQPGAAFDPANPGISILFMTSVVAMLGNETGVAIGAFAPSAREEFLPLPGEIPLDTCVEGPEAKVATCTSSVGCAPEQACVPEKDGSGAPIAGTEHCETPRSNLDVGPFVATGFLDGPKTFNYNPNQNGHYTTTPEGTVPPSILAFDTDYVFEGVGNAARGLGRFRGVVHFPPKTEIVSPAPRPGRIGNAQEIPVSPTAELVLEWARPSGGVLELTLQGVSGGTAGSARCRVHDDGAFTIPADKVAAAKLGGLAMLNALLVKRKNWGIACGTGITIANVMSESTVIYYVARE